jgi:predicted nucleic acid-binding protein
MVTLVDSSAWIEYLRGTESPAHLRLRGLIEDDEAIAITDVVAMEVLAGARRPGEASALQRLLGRARPLPTRPFFDHEAAARIFRACRAKGEIPRSLADCMIAAVAIRTGVPVLHADRDFDVIARHTELRVV